MQSADANQPRPDYHAPSAMVEGLRRMERLEASGAVGLTHRIHGEQLRLLHRDAPATLIANFAMALGAALALWTEVGPARAGLWVPRPARCLKTSTAVTPRASTRSATNGTCC